MRSAVLHRLLCCLHQGSDGELVESDNLGSHREIWLRMAPVRIDRPSLQSGHSPKTVQGADSPHQRRQLAKIRYSDCVEDPD